MPSASVLLSSLSGKAAMVSTEKARRASVTDIVPMALDLRPEKGKTSGPRLHCAFKLIRPTTAESMSTRGAAASGLAFAAAEADADADAYYGYGYGLGHGYAGLGYAGLGYGGYGLGYGGYGYSGLGYAYGKREAE